MILMYAKESNRGPILMCGILPDEVAMLKAGRRLFAALADYHKEMPPWTLDINCEIAERKDMAKRHIVISFQRQSLDQFVKQKMFDLPKESLGAPFNFCLFYTENHESVMTNMLAQGIDIEHFEDHRPGRMVN